MVEFKHGVLMEDGIVKFRTIDLSIIAIDYDRRHAFRASQDVVSAIFAHKQIVSAKEAKERIAILRQELDWCEDIFNTLEEITPEWLDEHWEEL